MTALFLCRIEAEDLVCFTTNEKLYFVVKLQTVNSEKTGEQDMQTNEKMSYQIRRCYASLRKSEKKVADYVLNHEVICRRMSLESLAERSGVSQPTVVRFVKALGFRGFKEFRYRLMENALSESRGGEQQAMYGYSLNPDEKLRMIPAKVIATSVRTLEDMLKSIPGEQFEKTVHMIAGARRVLLCCVENSSAAAKDLMTKLLYLGYDCRYDEDYYIQKIAAAALTEDDVVIGISYSGQSKDTVDVMKTAKKAGAQTIAITNFKDSRISQWSDIVLCSSQEQWLYGDCIFSRTTQIVLNDMIYMGLLAYDYDTRTAQLDKNSRIISDKAYQ